MAKEQNEIQYLTEASLGDVLAKLYPGKEFIHDKTVPDSGILKRPDYRNDNLKLIVEFDGDKHYREVQKIKSEQQKDEVYSKMGYSVVRIPYFIQISEATIKHLFGLNVKYEQIYPHGFISDNVVMPADFCELGIAKFKNDLFRFSFIKAEIIESLRNKIKILKDEELVIPPSLSKLII